MASNGARVTKARREGPEHEPDPASCRPVPRRRSTRTSLDAVQLAAPVTDLQDVRTNERGTLGLHGRNSDACVCSDARFESARLALEVM